MSMNLHLQAKAKVKFVSTGKKHTVRDLYQTLYQTPTEVTFDLLEQTDVFEAYKKYVLSTCIDKEYTEGHIKNVKEWIDKHVADGFTIEFFAM